MVFANYIDGAWVAGATFENRNPANTDELVGEFVNGTRLEMGGKNPTIVLGDCRLQDGRRERRQRARFFSTGQKCTATSRAIVEDIYDKFVHALVERTKKLKVGDGMKPGIDIGPAVIRVAAQHRPRIHRHRHEGGRQAAVRRQASDRHRTEWRGSLERLLLSPRRSSRTCPNACGSRRKRSSDRCSPIMRAKDFTDAMRIANNIPFGLSASMQTTNVSRVFDFVYQMEAGLLTVNLPSAGVEYQLPFGGTKESSFGPKEQGPAALDFYSDYKTVYLKY